MKIIIMLSVILLGIKTNLLAQEIDNKLLKIMGYSEVYSQQDFNNPKSDSRHGFVYSHNRNNEIDLNIGLIKAIYESEKVRINLDISVGAYMNGNYAVEERCFEKSL